MSMDQSPLQIKQWLHHLEMDEIYWRGLQKYSTTQAVRDMATRNLAEIRQSKQALQAYLKEPKNKLTNVMLSPIPDNPALVASVDLDRNIRETIETYLQAHEGDNYPPDELLT
jgi:hypothetical protein